MPRALDRHVAPSAGDTNLARHGVVGGDAPGAHDRRDALGAERPRAGAAVLLRAPVRTPRRGRNVRPLGVPRVRRDKSARPRISVARAHAEAALRQRPRRRRSPQHLRPASRPALIQRARLLAAARRYRDRTPSPPKNPASASRPMLRRGGELTARIYQRGITRAELMR